MSANAAKHATPFRLEYTVEIRIAAPAPKLWALLTDAAAQKRWNSTLASITGPIALGKKLAIRVPGIDRTFRPRVTAFEPPYRMEWSDGTAPFFRGVRTFTLTDRPDGRTEFAMVEVFSGLMLPLIQKSLPDFTAVFAQYADDLKTEAERTSTRS